MFPKLSKNIERLSFKKTTVRGIQVHRFNTTVFYFDTVFEDYFELHLLHDVFMATQTYHYLLSLNVMLLARSYTCEMHREYETLSAQSIRQVRYFKIF